MLTSARGGLRLLKAGRVFQVLVKVVIDHQFTIFRHLDVLSRVFEDPSHDYVTVDRERYFFHQVYQVFSVLEYKTTFSVIVSSEGSEVNQI